MMKQILINGLVAGGAYALTALGFTIIYKTVKFFHFAHGVVYTAAAYFAYSFFKGLCINPILSFFVASMLASALGILIDRVVYLPLRKNSAPNLVFLIASFGVFVLIQNFLQLLYGAQILTLRTIPIAEGFKILSTVITTIQVLILSAATILFVVTWLLLKKTKMGKAVRAVADDVVGATVSGIYPEKVILYAFGVGSALAGMAGILISLETNIEPTMGLNAVLKGMVASIIGGMGSIPGAILGGLFLGIIENLAMWKIQAAWKDTLTFAVLVAFLLLRPEGILGRKGQKERT